MWKSLRMDPRCCVLFATFTRDRKRRFHLTHVLSLLFARISYTIRRISVRWNRRLGSGEVCSAIRVVCEFTVNPFDKGQWAPLGAVTRVFRRRRRPARNTKSCSNRRECHDVEKIGRNTRGRCARTFIRGIQIQFARSLHQSDLNSYSSEFREFFAQ